MQSACVRCGKVLEAATLDELTKLAARCCKRKGTKKEQASLAPPKPLTVSLPFTVQLPCRVQSQNSFNWKHWSVYAGYKKKVFAAMAQPMLPLQGCRLLWSKWTIIRHYAKTQREFDMGNLVGGMKPFPDALKHLGVIHDDAPRYFVADYKQVQDGQDLTTLRLESIHATTTTTEVSGI